MYGDRDRKRQGVQRFWEERDEESEEGSVEEEEVARVLVREMEMEGRQKRGHLGEGEEGYELHIGSGQND